MKDRYFVSEVKNLPAITYRYVVARLIEGRLWFWGSWESFDDAFNVAVELENGIVVERIEE